MLKFRSRTYIIVTIILKEKETTLNFIKEKGYFSKWNVITY